MPRGDPGAPRPDLTAPVCASHRPLARTFRPPIEASMSRTQVGIIGAGPAGLVLSLLLARSGIESIVLEGRSRDHVSQRVRAGLLEQNTVDLLRELDVAARLDREGMVHHGIALRRDGETRRIPITDMTGRVVTIYGQQEVVKDLIAAHDGGAGEIHFEVDAVEVDHLDGPQPLISYVEAGERKEIRCDFIAGCDGFHGIT